MWWTAAIAGATPIERRLPVQLDTAPLTSPVHVVVPIVVPPDRLARVERHAIAVLASDGEPLPFEIEGWGDPLGTTLWVDPGVSYPGLDRALWVVWRTSGRPHPDAVELVWPAPWVGVWHLDGCGQRCPSSIRGAGDAVLVGAEADEGRFARGRAFDGAGSVQVPLGDAVDAERLVTYAWTWSDDALPGRTVANFDAVGVVRCEDAASFRFSGGTETMCAVPAALEAGLWQLLTFELVPRRGAVTFRAAVDGRPVHPLALDDRLVWSDTSAWTIGPRHSSDAGGELPFVGRVDELRVATEALPASAILAEHHFASGGVWVGEPEPVPSSSTADTGEAHGSSSPSSSRLVGGRCDAGGAPAWLGWLVAIAVLVRRRAATGATLAAAWASGTAWAAPPDLRLPITLDARGIPATVQVVVPIVVPTGPTGFDAAGRDAASVAFVDDADQPLQFEPEGWGDPDWTTFWVDPGELTPGEQRTVWLVWTAGGAPHPDHLELVWPAVWAGVWHFDVCPDGEQCRAAQGGGPLDVEGTAVAGQFGPGWRLAAGDRIRFDLDRNESPTPLVVYAWVRFDDDDDERTLLTSDAMTVVRCGDGIQLGAGALVPRYGACSEAVLSTGQWQLVTVQVAEDLPQLAFDATVDDHVVTDRLPVVAMSDTPRLELGPPANGELLPFVGDVDELRVAYTPIPRDTRIAEFVLASQVWVGEQGGEPPVPTTPTQTTGTSPTDTGLGHEGTVWSRGRAGRCDTGSGTAPAAAIAAAALWLLRRLVRAPPGG